MLRAGFEVIFNYRDLICIVAPTLSGCSVAFLDRSNNRTSYGDGWAEQACDRLAGVGTYNVLSTLHSIIDGANIVWARADAKTRFFVCSEIFLPEVGEGYTCVASKLRSTTTDKQIAVVCALEAIKPLLGSNHAIDNFFCSFGKTLEASNDHGFPGVCPKYRVL